MYEWRRKKGELVIKTQNGQNKAPFLSANLITLWNDKSNYSPFWAWLDQNRSFSEENSADSQPGFQHFSQYNKRGTSKGGGGLRTDPQALSISKSKQVKVYSRVGRVGGFSNFVPECKTGKILRSHIFRGAGGGGGRFRWLSNFCPRVQNWWNVKSPYLVGGGGCPPIFVAESNASNSCFAIIDSSIFTTSATRWNRIMLGNDLFVSGNETETVTNYFNFKDFFEWLYCLCIDALN